MRTRVAFATTAAAADAVGAPATETLDKKTQFD
jgi:hypothetical protein